MVFSGQGIVVISLIFSWIKEEVRARAGYGTRGVASRRGGAGGGQVGVASPGLRSTSRPKMFTLEGNICYVIPRLLASWTHCGCFHSFGFHIILLCLNTFDFYCTRVHIWLCTNALHIILKDYFLILKVAPSVHHLRLRVKIYRINLKYRHL